MARILATITGTAIRPGVSANSRLYTADAIGRMVARAQARIDSGGPPLTMRVCHPADPATAPVTETVGRVTRVWQEPDGSAKFAAVLADTPDGRTVANLVDSSGGPPFVEGVSIRGAWVGQPSTILHDGQPATTGQDIELDGIDLTHRPGVTGARIDGYAAGRTNATEAAGTASGRVLIFESAPAAQVIPSAPAPPELPATPLHKLPTEQRGEFTRATWSAVFASRDERRPRSPFWQSMTGPQGPEDNAAA